MQNGYLMNYGLIVTDPSILLYDLSYIQGEFSGGKQIVIPDCFDIEATNIQELLPSPQKEQFQRNLQWFCGLQRQSKGMKTAWELVQGLSSEGKTQRIAVVTANELLLERVILSELEVDIVDIRDGIVKRWECFAQLKQKYQLADHSTVCKIPDDMQKEKIKIVYRANGEIVTLTDVVSDLGLEAVIYRVQQSLRLVAKIFKEDMLTVGKWNHIQRLRKLHQNPLLSWVTLPCDALYFDAECQIPIGYLQPYVENAQELRTLGIVKPDIQTFTTKEYQTPIVDTLSLCRQLVSQVILMGYFGIYITDFNLGNFAIKDSFIWMWDSDSFSLGDYTSGNCDSCVALLSYSHKDKLQALRFSEEALHTLIFRLCTASDEPLYEDEEDEIRFKWDNTSYVNIERKKLMPVKLAEYFDEVYHQKQAFSAIALLEQLERACSTVPEFQTYGKVLGVKKASLLIWLLILLFAFAGGLWLGQWLMQLL